MTSAPVTINLFQGMNGETAIRSFSKSGSYKKGYSVGFRAGSASGYKTGKSTGMRSGKSYQASQKTIINNWQLLRRTGRIRYHKSL